MTTLAIQQDRWTFRGTDLSSYTVLVRAVDGAEDLPVLRGGNIPIPNLAGQRWAPKLPDAKRLALALHITDMNASGGLTEPTVFRQAQENLETLRTLFATNGEGALVHYLPDGSSRTAQAEVVRFQSVDALHGRVAFMAIVDFELADPYFYAADVVDSGRSIAASPTDFVLTNPGEARTHRVLFDFTGPISNPRVENLANGVYVECLVTVASATHLLVDCELFTAQNDGVNAIASIRHSGDFRWMLLEPGAQTLRVTATSPGGTLTTTASAPYHA
jgi:hypothetical protein